MTNAYPLIDIATVRPRASAGHGWDSAAAVRIAVSGADGASTLAYHAELLPGTGRARHANRHADEILIYLAGAGTAEVGGVRHAVRAGHCQFVPKGVAHGLAGDAAAGPMVIVGFYPFAPSLADTGFEDRSTAGANGATGGALVHLDDIAPAAMEAAAGWSISDFRLPIGRHTGAGSTLFRAQFRPGAVHKKHRHDRCEEIYFVISGRGVAGAGPDRVWVHGGHFHHVPKGVEHWLATADTTDPIEVVGIYVGAGTVAETGYVYLGEVTPEDVKSAGHGP